MLEILCSIMREKRIVEADPEITEMLELAGSLK